MRPVALPVENIAPLSIVVHAGELLAMAPENVPACAAVPPIVALVTVTPVPMMVLASANAAVELVDANGVMLIGGVGIDLAHMFLLELIKFYLQ
jgi:hypothetical protein